MIWAIRGHFKSYQKEDSGRATETALFTERISGLNLRCDAIHNRVAEIEKSQQETHILRLQVSNMGEDIKSVKSSIDSIIKLLLEKVV